MRNFLLVCWWLCVLAGHACAQDAARWKAEAGRVGIVRDDWGIAHIHGKSDADAVFGMIYAQCEDDFNRVEMNYLTSLGRLAEAEGESAIWADLRQRLFIDPEQLKKEYVGSPLWLKKLMDAWADGINFYLAKHPETKPKVLTRFEPWMALSFTEGSIGGDIERVDLDKLESFTTEAKFRTFTTSDPVIRKVSRKQPAGARDAEHEPGGSNGIAISPELTKNGYSLLLINPHTSFFFRSELQVTSDEGLNAYGAVTWGQFFVYQGFNDRAGWMHTSSNVDAVDEYVETVSDKDGKYYTSFGKEKRRVRSRTLMISYKTDQGLKLKTVQVFYSVHGPLVRLLNQNSFHKWVAIKLMQRHVAALEQSYLRTKARNYSEYKKTMELMANSSNNTVYADADGTIAYWHGDFIPRRNDRFDYTKPVDGSDPATDWHGLLTLAEVPQLKNPASGWLFNVNDSPWNGAGVSSLKKTGFPVYVERGIESARGIHAMRLLTGASGWTPETLRAAAYDSYLPWFNRTIPALVQAAGGTPSRNIPESALSDQVAMLRDWNKRWAEDSEATTLAVYWGTEVMKTAGPAARAAAKASEDWVATKMPPEQLLEALRVAVQRLETEYGDWGVEWGEVNRFQRLTADIAQPFNDSGASIAVPFVSSVWGSLASFGAKPYPGTKRWYGTSGNSFVAVVEFGPKVHAVAVTAGGESGNPSSPHFNDQATRYATGKLREVYFYPDQLTGHTERTYRPGQ